MSKFPTLTTVGWVKMPAPVLQKGGSNDHLMWCSGVPEAWVTWWQNNRLLSNGSHLAHSWESTLYQVQLFRRFWGSALYQVQLFRRFWEFSLYQVQLITRLWESTLYQVQLFRRFWGSTLYQVQLITSFWEFTFY